MVAVADKFLLVSPRRKEWVLRLRQRILNDDSSKNKGRPWEGVKKNFYPFLPLNPSESEFSSNFTVTDVALLPRPSRDTTPRP